MTNIEILCFSKEIEKQMKEDKPLIKNFCKKYNVEFLSFTTTTEKGNAEPAYIFSDGLGYYTIEGIKKSL